MSSNLLAQYMATLAVACVVRLVSDVSLGIKLCRTAFVSKALTVFLTETIARICIAHVEPGVVLKSQLGLSAMVTFNFFEKTPKIVYDFFIKRLAMGTKNKIPSFLCFWGFSCFLYIPPNVLLLFQLFLFARSGILLFFYRKC